MFTVYAVYNKEHDKIYIGQTKDMDERLELHNNKEFKDSYTSRFTGECLVIYKESCPDRKQALIRERQLKSYRGREFVKKFIEN